MSNNDPQNGDGVEHLKVPLLTITYDPRAYKVNIGGSVPSWEFGEALLYMALREVERIIRERRAQKMIELATPELLPPADWRSKP